MMKSGQCFTCYDDAMFRYHGQSGNFNPTQLQIDYVDKLADGDIVDCITCGCKVKYVKINDNKWREEYVK